MAFKVPDGTIRVNTYLQEDLYERVSEYCEKNFISKTAFFNQCVRQFFNGIDAMQSMGNLAELMNVFAKQTGIDLTAGQASSPERG